MGSAVGHGHHPASLRTSSSSSHSRSALPDARDAVDERVDDAAQRSVVRRSRPRAGRSGRTSRSSRTSASSSSASPSTDGATVAAASASSSIRSTGRSSREPRPPSTSATTPAPRRPGGNGEEDRVRHANRSAVDGSSAELARRPRRRRSTAAVYTRGRAEHRADPVDRDVRQARRHPRRRRLRPVDRRRRSRPSSDAVALRRARRRRARRVHVHRLVRAAGARPGADAASPRQAAGSRSWRRPNRRAACSRLPTLDRFVPVFETLAEAVTSVA